MTLMTSPLAQYQEFLARGELAYQVDADDRPVFFPRVLAPAGFQGTLTWTVSKGLGTVYATTHIAPKGEPTYNVALIDMDEGYRLMSRVEGLPAEQVCIGMRVKARIHPSLGEQDPYPVFDVLEEK